MDIRLQTRIILKRGAEFLVGRVMFSRDLKWSTSAWDAWHTRDIEQAEKLALTLGADLWLFNPVAGQLREFKRKEGGLTDGTTA